MNARPMTAAQRVVLRELSGSAQQVGGHLEFPGYCELMARTGCTSYKAVDWVLDALKRRGYIVAHDDAGYSITDAGRAAIAKATGA